MSECEIKVPLSREIITQRHLHLSRFALKNYVVSQAEQEIARRFPGKKCTAKKLIQRDSFPVYGFSVVFEVDG